MLITTFYSQKQTGTIRTTILTTEQRMHPRSDSESMEMAQDAAGLGKHSAKCILFRQMDLAEQRYE